MNPWIHGSAAGAAARAAGAAAGGAASAAVVCIHDVVIGQALRAPIYVQCHDKSIQQQQKQQHQHQQQLQQKL